MPAGTFAEHSSAFALNCPAVPAATSGVIPRLSACLALRMLARFVYRTRIRHASGDEPTHVCMQKLGASSQLRSWLACSHTSH
eukprot:2193459-Pleurochrysis_carterae.AAC.1